MHWFERHVNWTMIIGIAGAYLVVLMVGIYGAKADPNHENTTLAVIAPIMLAILPLIPCAWVLKKKSRSMFWLLLSWFIFIGWIIPLVLPNNKEPSSVISTIKNGHLPRQTVSFEDSKVNNLCPECGHKLDYSAKFCGNCGTRTSV